MSIFKTHPGEVAKAIRDHRYDLTEDGGIYLPRSKVFIGGAGTCVDMRDGHTQSVSANVLLLEGLTHMLNSSMPPAGGYPQTAQWYYAPFKNDFTPDGSETAASLPATAGEFTAYTNATRLPLTITAAAALPTAGSTANTQLTFNAGGPYDIYGFSIVSAQAKSAVTGKGLACVRLASPRLGFLGGDNVAFGYQISAADAG